MHFSKLMIRKDRINDIMLNMFACWVKTETFSTLIDGARKVLKFMMVHYSDQSW